MSVNLNYILSIQKSFDIFNGDLIKYDFLRRY